MPGNNIKRFALEGKKTFRKVLDVSYEMVEEEMVAGIIHFSMSVFDILSREMELRRNP